MTPPNYHNPLPGVTIADGLCIIDLRALLRHFGRPTDEAHQHELAKTLAASAEEMGVPFVTRWLPRMAATEVN